MFPSQITHACQHFPTNNQERFVYPAIACYSMIENLVMTAVGVIFTALSVLSLGRCKTINDIANWTCYSRGLLTIPLQIIGNIFKIHSEILTDYNRGGNIYAEITASMSTPLPNLTNNQIDKILQKTAVQENGLIKAKILCTKLFQTRTASKIDLLAKHLIFRLSSLIDEIASLSISIFFICPTSIVFIPVALYNQGMNTKYNDYALIVSKLPKIIHLAALNLRMIINPLQFVNESSEELKLDESPKYNALIASGIWENPFELNRF